MAQVARLGDEWEGTFPRATSQIFSETATRIAAQGDVKFLSLVKRSWLKSYGEARHRVFASCWQFAHDDVWWMWKTYCQTAYAVAVRSTYELLDSALPLEIHGRPVLIGMVSYGDYDSDTYVTDPSNVFSAMMSKRNAFRDEREVRVLCDIFTSTEGETGFFIPVDLARLLTSIVVSPIAPGWFRDIVEATTSAFNCSVRVDVSRIRQEPTFPF